MIRYITRHGQVEDYRDQNISHLYPPGDIPLSDLGREQARLLGERLKSMNFHGRIISSPYDRALETANIIARVTDTKITPFALVREIIQSQGHADKFAGMTIEQIREKYDRIDENAELEYPWWHAPGIPARVESFDEVRARVRYGLELLELRYPDEELLIVAHGAPSDAAIQVLGIPEDYRKKTRLFNCSLSVIDPKDSTVPTMYCDTSHLPYEITTSNYLTREEFDNNYFESECDHEIELPEGIESIKGTKILHIGDTESFDFPHFFKIIDMVKPDVIIHTGDMVDEVKAGRIPEVRQEYLAKVKSLLSHMSASGARLIIVPGNNDLPDEIAKLCPEAEIYPENTILTFDGVECRVAHMIKRMTYDKKWNFYGHGFGGEEWSVDKNIPGGEQYRFNAYWGTFICSLAEDKFYMIPLTYEA